MPVPVCADGGKRRAGIPDYNSGDALRCFLADHRRRAALHRARNVAVPVGLKAADGDKEVSGAHRAGVITDLRDFRIHVRARGTHRDSF